VTIASNTSTYDPPANLAVSTWYRRQAKDGTCNTTFTSSTGVWAVTVQSAVTAGAIGTAQTICNGNTPAALTSATAGTGSGTISYQWQTNAGGSYVDISGATSATYAPPSLTATASYQRRTVSTQNGVPCSAYTAPVTITVNPVSVGGTASSNQTICNGGSPADITLTGNTGTIQWQSSTDNITFNNIAGATATPLTSAQMGSLTATRYYRAVVTSGVCASASSTTVTVTVNPPVINDGTLTGYLTANNPPGSNIINVTACPQDGVPKNAFISLSGNTGNIIRWEYSEINISTGVLSWLPIANTTSTYTFNDILKTTSVRVVTQIGNCGLSYSSLFIMNVIPPNIKPTVNNTNFAICLGSTVTVTATSSFAASGIYGDGGSFESSNPPGWRVDYPYIDRLPASASNSKPNNFAIATSTPAGRNFSGTLYNASINSDKYVIVNGDVFTETGRTFSTLETPVFNTLGLSTATLTFDQAYYLGDSGPTNPKAEIRVELSLDGGVTYNITLGPTYNGVSTSGAGTHFGNFVATTINLQNYIGLTNLRIRFYYESNRTTTSSWALDNIKIPDKPISEAIQWTDIAGNVFSSAENITFNPQTPGVQKFGVTSLIDGCRSVGDEGTEFITVNASYAYAGKNMAPPPGECGVTSVKLNAYDNRLSAKDNYLKGAYDAYVVNDPAAEAPGTMILGTWSVLPATNICGNPVFSNINDPDATFSGGAGTYTLTWTVGGCTSPPIQIILEDCSNVNFDGANDYVTFNDNYNLTTPFSFSVWVKPNSVTGTQTIFSKRDINNLSAGYDLKLTGDIVSFNWNSTGSIVSPNPISTNRWYHLAVTFGGGTYKLYIDGIEVKNVSGSAPLTNNFECLLGAMGNPLNIPVNHFNGWMDEVRIWDVALTANQLREMMNQEIEANGSAVKGKIVPANISVNLAWASLQGYYNMSVGCGFLTPIKGIAGKLRNVTISQQETAPIPYTSRVDGQEWRTKNTWTHGDVWDAPNSLGVDNITPIDWNIVRTTHDITSGNKDITVLGLLSESGKLTIADPVGSQNENNPGQGLTVTHYLKLNGVIDLIGESQLVQNEGSILDAGSGGYLERDQQGTQSSFNYNYWSSSVSVATGNAPYTVAGVLSDGTTSSNPLSINFVDGAYSADGALSSPIKISNRWIYKFNGLHDDYNSWLPIGSSGALSVGDGYTMKGTNGAAGITANQNYVFKGKPNNGTITLSIAAGNDRLIGNPYPSAIDANEFILDNIKDSGGRNSQNVFNGVLYFWDHFGGTTHVLREYIGGYATYSLIGGVNAISNDSRINATGGSGTKVPERYIPVSQGFFVNAVSDPILGDPNITSPIVGGNITFKNSQRIFKREVVTGVANNGSIFIRTTSKNNSASTNLKAEINKEPRIRIQFESPKGYVRQLLLGAHPNTSNNFDLGYDAPLIENNVEDLFWLINNSKCVIQGVKDLNKKQVLPLGVKIEKNGGAKIKVIAVENAEEGFEIYIKDNSTGETYKINNQPFEISLAPGEYLNRFEMVFQPRLKRLDEVSLEEGVRVFVNNTASTLNINKIADTNITGVDLYNYLGQSIKKWNNNLDERTTLLPIYNVASGIYLVHISTENGIIVKRVYIE
ncbi:MAG: LamG-like jellyroll fold domain-containing protein, partial [Flavobacteriaceae bacterium]|nr:LamG-like jellyroll fold domain-containing protein [Flavobacteriaceae bacterium]